MLIKKVLITGGLGFIGSHVTVEVLNSGFDVVVVDNLNNSNIDVLDSIKQITSKSNNIIKFYNVDLTSENKTNEIFNLEKPNAVIHLAGLKAVNESIQKPIDYYYNNIVSTLNILNSMKYFNCDTLIFSSSATVYGSYEPPFDESCPIGIGITNPYGQTKFMIETMLKDLSKSNSNLKIISLRYFNPVGAHESRLLGEDPNDIPNNLMPLLLKTGLYNLKKNYKDIVNKNPNDNQLLKLSNKLSKINLDNKYENFTIFGNDYPTKDGTAERDYIHVVDLAKGHMKVLEQINLENNTDNKFNGYHVYNLGTGNSISVKEIVDKFKEVNKIDFGVINGPKREGDVGISYAKPNKAHVELNWKTEKKLEDMVKDAWYYQLNKYNLVEYFELFNL